MPAYRQTDQLFVTCVAGRKNYVSTIISGGEIGVNRKRKQGDEYGLIAEKLLLEAGNFK